MITLEFNSEFSEIFKKRPDRLLFHFHADHRSVKNLIEHSGVPHTEVGSILVRGPDHFVDFSYRPRKTDHFIIETLKGPVDVTKPTLLRDQAFPANTFIVDECVANLAPKLRMLGCDVISDRIHDDQDIARISFDEKRVVLTRDRGLLMRKEVIWGHYIRTKTPDEQLREVIDFFSIRPLQNALQRCLVCNGILERVDKNEILEFIGPKTRLYYDDFSRCQKCKKIYWEGSHFEKMQKNLTELYPVATENNS